MAEEIDRGVPEFLFDALVNGPLVFKEDVLPSLIGDVAEFRGVDPVAAHIGDDDRVAVAGEEFAERVITFLMLLHAVDDLQDRFGFLHGEKGEGKLIALRAFDKKVFHMIPFLSDAL